MGRRLIAGLGALAIATLPSACGGARPVADDAQPSSTETRREDALAARPEQAPRAARPDRVRVRAIFVSIESRTAEAAEGRARMLARTARADDFSQLASEYGDGGNAPNLGSAGLLLAPDDERVPSSVRDAAFDLEVREISRPIASDEGYWVLQRLE